MGGEEGGEQSVLLNDVPAASLTAKVKAPSSWSLKELERGGGKQRESWDLLCRWRSSGELSAP